VAKLHVEEASVEEALGRMLWGGCSMWKMLHVEEALFGGGERI